MVPDDLAPTVAARLWRRCRETDGVDHALIESELKSAGLEFGASGLSSEEFENLKRTVTELVVGLGPLEPLFRDASITEIMVNGEHQLFVERQGRVERAAGSFFDAAHLRSVIDRIVGAAGRRVDLSSPVCDVRLSDGSRVNVVLPPISLNGPVLTIRRFRRSLLTLEDLISEGTLSPRDAGRLVESIKNRENIVIAGNSGSGKTTLLNILSRFIDPTERIITLEDAAELSLQQPHVVRLETRVPNAEGGGEMSMGALVINALRMRPDRLIIGECRGAEAIPMLQAMNTGHDGSMTTLHANSAADAVQRLESMVLLGAPQWPADVVRRQIASGLDLIVYLKRSAARRTLEELVNVVWRDNGIVTEPL